MKCPNCGFDSPRQMHFCGSCGTRLTSACSTCGFANPLDYRFCGMCGTKLESAAAELPLQPHQLSAENEALTPVAQEFPLEGERRVVTVVVTDLTDSTPLLESIGTESWVELMHHILHILESEVGRFGGEVSQFRGDGLVAFFGATSAHEDDPERAVLAALSMQRTFEQYLHDHARPEAQDLQMRVGVNTGEVIVTRESERQQWVETAMGLAVSIAARMEAAAAPGTVLVSEHTHRLIEKQFEWEASEEITIKGVSQPIAVYRPRMHIADSNQPSDELVFFESITRIGRESEFRALRACVEGLFEGLGRIATVTGDKGSGKAFLLNEVRQYFAHRGALLAEAQAGTHSVSSTIRWIAGRCRSYTDTWPYALWMNLFQNLLDIRPDQSKEEKCARLRKHTEELWGDGFDEHYPYLASFLGLPLEESFTEKIRHLNAEGLRQRIFLTVRSEIEELSRKSPLVLSISDLQWVDDSSLALLKYCLSVADNEAVLWLLAFRLDRESSVLELQHYVEVEYPHRLTNIELQPLTESQGREIINNLIGAEALPAETRDVIVKSAGGNPYYILELIRSLIVRGILTRASADEPWRLARKVTTLDLPDSLQRLLLARIDRLAPHERAVLQIASVIGHVFWFNMVEAMLGGTPTLRADLITLQRNEFIQERGRVPELGMRYYFATPLIRDAAYDSLLGPQRTAYHLKAAIYLETIANSDVLDGYDGLLAYHYAGSGNQRKELFYTILAAEQARRIYANSEALQYYDHALELLEGLAGNAPLDLQNRAIQTQRFEILNGRRELHYKLGQVAASRADTQALLPIARAMADDPVWLIDALMAQADIPTANREEIIAVQNMVEEALALSQQRGDQQREMQSLVRLANIRFILKDPSWQELGERALALAQQLGDLNMEVNLLLGIGHAYGIDDLPRSREYLEAALSRSTTLNDKATELDLLQAVGQQVERDGDYHRQLVEYEQKRVRLSREIGNRVIEGNALMFCGQIQALYLGDYENGLDLEKQALRILENMTNKLFPLLRIAQIQTVLGRYEEAQATLETARPFGNQTVYKIGQAGLNLVTAVLYNARGGEANLRAVLEITLQLQQMVADNLVSRQYQIAAACEASAAHLKLARVLHDETAWEEHQHKALEFSQKGLDQYEAFGFVQIVECTSEEIFFRHSQALAANGRDTEAAKFLQRAFDEMMRKHDLIPPDSQFRKTFLENIELHRDIRTEYAVQTKMQHLTSLPHSDPLERTDS